MLDVLLAVHVECKNSEKLKREKAYASFIQKYDSLVTELNGLKLTKEDFEPKNVIGRGHFGEVIIFTILYLRNTSILAM